MSDIIHRVGIDAPPDSVFVALTTVDGLRNWWTNETTGNASQDGIVDFGFCAMRVTDADAPSLVRWVCVAGPPDWVDTEVTFRLEWKDEQTFVYFTHGNWREVTEFMYHCSTKWGVFLLSLRDLLEGREAHPAPHAVPICRND